MSSSKDLFIKLEDCNVLIDTDTVYFVYDFERVLKLPKTELDTKYKETIEEFKKIQGDLVATLELRYFKKSAIALFKTAPKRTQSTLKTSRKDKTITITTPQDITFTYKCEDVHEDLKIQFQASKMLKVLKYLKGDELDLRVQNTELYFITDSRRGILAVKKV